MSKSLFVVKASEYKVKDGDSLDSLAKKAGITWQELARFNWGTDNPDKINQYLRNKVGCFKKTDDGYNYIFSKDDDPGIIYIPEDFESAQYNTNNNHTIKFKLPNVKTFTPADCVMKFRPKKGWKGEDYGFDWLREADYDFGGLFGDLDYTNDIIGKLHIPEKAAAADQYLQPDSNSTDGKFIEDKDMLNGLRKDEYIEKPKIKFIGDDSEVPNLASYISIYNNDTDVPLPVKVEIMAYITVQEEQVDAIYFESDTDDVADYLKITPDDATPLTKISPSKKKELKLYIECIKQLPFDITISAIAASRSSDGADRTVEVGRLIIVANDAFNRKHINMLLVEVKTPPINATMGAAVPDMKNQKELFTKILRQALINPKFDSPNIRLDINALPAKDRDFFIKNYTTTRRGNKVIKAYQTIGGKYDPSFVRIQDYLKEKLEAQLKDMKSPMKVDNYVMAFYFGEDGGMVKDGVTKGLNGYADGKDGKYVVMFASKNEGTSPHEFLHALGLPHTFDAGVQKMFDGVAIKSVSDNAAYSYKPLSTENIMDYSHQRKEPGSNNARCTLFHWQWKVAFKSKNAKDNDS